MPDPGGKEIQYWDSPVFISFLAETQADRVETFKQMLRNLQMPLGQFRVILSTMVIVEVRAAATDSPQHTKIISELFDTDRPYLQFYAVSQRIARRARDLVVQHPDLTNPDAIHLATALEGGADVFLTYDGARDPQRRRSGGLLKHNNQLGNPPLRVEAPQYNWGPLFTQSQVAPTT